MDICKICDRNSTLETCSVCQVKSCETCLNSHQTLCSAMKEHRYHMCKVHREQHVCAYCEQCSELICENCRCTDHKNHVIKSMKTAIDNFRKDIPMVDQELEEKYDHLKKAMEILEKDHSLSQHKMGTTTKPTNEHLLELLQEAKTNFDFLEKESFPLTFLSRWSYGMRAFNKYKQLQSAATESSDKLHQQEKTFILGMANSIVTWIDDIRKRKKTVNYSSLGRPQNKTLVSFVKDMELILNRVTDMKNDMLATEGILAAKLVDIAKWTDEQRQTEEDLKREIQEKAKTINAQDKELKIRLSRIKEINSASDALKNENNKLRQQIFDNQKEATQQQINQSHKLEVENDVFRRSLNRMNTELQQRAAHIESLQRALQDLTYQINNKDEQIRDVKRETDDLRTRLDSLAGDELTKDTPSNTALGDPNRSMKIAEKYGELYDNEWTDAIDCTVEVKALYPEMKTAGIEEVIIRHIYQLVMCCYRECLALSKEQLKDVGNMIVNALKLNTKRHGTNIPCCKEVSNIRRQGAAEYADYLFQHKVIVDKIVLSDWEYVHKSKELFGLLTQTPFFEKCIHLCWHMAIKDPVMHLDEELTPDTTYDKSVYREFAKSGDKVTFVVWPALFLHEGGPLLNKGVVQAYC